MEDSLIKTKYDGFIDAINFKNNSNLIINTLNNIKNIEGAIKINNNKNTLEGYYNNKWKSLSQLYNSDYTTFIDLKKHSLLFYQNNNINLNINNNFNTLHKSIFKESIYSKKTEINNVIINNSLILNKDFINKGYLKLPYKNTETGIKGNLRFDPITGKIQYYTDKWENIGIDSNFIKIDNLNNLIIQSNGIICTINNNSANLYKNVNIFKNCDLNNINVKYNTTLTENILINNNPIIFNNNTNKLFIRSSSNYNKSDLELLEINENTTNNIFYNKYISKYLYVNANYDSYSYCLNNYNHNNNFIPGNINNFIYHYFGTENININNIEFIYFSNNNQINLYIDNLNNISNYFSIIISDDKNNIIYNSDSGDIIFTLKKISTYTIKLKILNTILSNINSNIFIKLYGYYTNNKILFKNNNN